MNEGGDQEHTLPLLPCLQRGCNKRVEYKKEISFERTSQNAENAHVSHLMFGHSTDYEWANHPRKGAHTVGDTHKYASVARRNVQVVDIETLRRK